MVCMAQNRIVKGVVFDADGLPLAGVTVSDENSTTSTQSLDGGQFEMSVSPYTKYVVATAEGYLTARAEIDGSYLVLTLKVDKKYKENKLKAEKEARLVAEKEALAKAKAKEEARIAAEKEALAKAKAKEEARIAAEKEALAKAKAEEEARIAAEKEAKAKAKAEEKARLAAEKETQASAVKDNFVAATTESNKDSINSNTTNSNRNLGIGIGIVSGFYGETDCYGLVLDYICHRSNNGFKTYAMVNVGRDVYNVDCGGYIDFTSYTATAGAGYGIPITNFLEITPFITAGGLFMPDEIKEFINDTLLSYIVEPGARIALTYKSLSVFASAGVHWNFEASEIYSTPTYYFPADGFFFKVGAKWTF